MQILEASTKGVCLFGYLLILPKLCTYWISLHRHLLKIGPSQAKKFFSISPWLNEWFGGRYWQKWRWRSLNSDCLKNNFASLNFRRNEPKIFERLWRGARREEERIATKNGMARWDRIWGADIEREFRRSASRYYFDAPRFPTFLAEIFLVLGGLQVHLLLLLVIVLLPETESMPLTNVTSGFCVDGAATSGPMTFRLLNTCEQISAINRRDCDWQTFSVQG